ncbi:hypothetical protein, partial [Streptomyces rochei]|uniref:hypothetical protein n=1 Tax=Streptomyces rochei TaxID=1928 RepID=UPI0022EA0D97
MSDSFSKQAHIDYLHRLASSMEAQFSPRAGASEKDTPCERGTVAQNQTGSPLREGMRKVVLSGALSR